LLTLAESAQYTSKRGYENTQRILFGFSFDPQLAHQEKNNLAIHPAALINPSVPFGQNIERKQVNSI
jgi:hypothetical protein